jgi:hypothetical protein
MLNLYVYYVVFESVIWNFINSCSNRTDRELSSAKRTKRLAVKLAVLAEAAGRVGWEGHWGAVPG